MSSKNANPEFLAHLGAIPAAEGGTEIAALGRTLGPGTLAHLEAVVSAGLLPKDQACKWWADGLGLAYVDVAASVVTDQAVALIPLEIAQKLQAIGLYVVDDVLTVALAQPAEADLVRRLQRIIQVPVSPVFGFPADIAGAIAIHYCTESSLQDSLGLLMHHNCLLLDGQGEPNLEAVAESEPLARVLEEILYHALRERATDIHVEAGKRESRIRFRVDGNLRLIARYPRKLHRALITRFKVLCNLNIAETRFPQDGSFSVPVGTSQASFRLSTIPSLYGEKAMVRLLTQAARQRTQNLEEMLMAQPVLQPFRQILRNASGIVFVTGPTGSGKTTTLYAGLAEINDPKINICTIEDPIEIPLGGLTQSQVNTHIDLKFATLLRSLLRQDPDVILVGEIRDAETARIATEAALTGHLVLATLHTINAPQAITRLVDLGVEPYLVAPSVSGVLAQRLVARICSKCREPYQPDREVLLRYFEEEEGLAEVPFYRGRGCAHCRGTGYHGRVAIHELVLVTDEIRQLITEGRSAQDITRAAARMGYRPMRYDGLRKVLMGLTTIEEVETGTTFEWSG